MDIEMKFGFGISFDEVKAIVQRRIDASEAILKEPKPRFGVSTVDPDGYKVMINLWVPAHGFMEQKLKFQEKIIQDLKDAQLKLPGM
jgi:small conductance mechanosensitive channel